MSESSETQPQTAAPESFKLRGQDTGSSEFQITNLTQRIEALTPHFKAHAKDFAGRRGLLSLVSKRRTLLSYLKKTSAARYASILEKLNLRH